jgi:hypothetical protein
MSRTVGAGVCWAAPVAGSDRVHSPRDEPLIVVATGEYLGEGFDCPQLDTLFWLPVSYTGPPNSHQPGQPSARALP